VSVADHRPSALQGRRGGVFAFHRTTANEHYWDEIWTQTEIETGLLEARRSPLTTFLRRHIRAGDKVLEGGCGLGIYSALLSEAGADVIGIDFSRGAIDAQVRAFPDHDARVGRLEELPFEDVAFDVYVSIGVIEHDPEASPAILTEARRVLRPGGALLLAVPYLNWSRKMLRPRLARWQDISAAEGAAFYQYAFDARALDDLLAQAGFNVVDRDYYNPGRGIRSALAVVRNQRAKAMQRRKVDHRAAERAEPRHRAALRWPLTLRLFAHMHVVKAIPVSDQPPRGSSRPSSPPVPLEDDVTLPSSNQSLGDPCSVR
jgi:SAM-dependent methyltransferase